MKKRGDFMRSDWRTNVVLAAIMSGTFTLQASFANNLTSPVTGSRTVQESNIIGSDKITGYAPINGMRVYYEVEGKGRPVIFIPPMFGVVGTKSFALLSRNHSVVSLDLQGNGRTADISERPLSIENNAEDVVALMDYLKIPEADFIGESYGAAAAIMIAIKHPDRVGRIAAYAGTFGPTESAHNKEMLHFDRPPTPDSNSFTFQREAYKKVSPDPDHWPQFWQKALAVRWEGFSDEQLLSVKVPVLIVVGDHDFVRVEHAAETLHRIPGAELAVIPDAGHFALFSEPERVIPVIQQFLEKPAGRVPVATAEIGYHPDKTR